MASAANGERQQCAPDRWLRAKLRSYFPAADAAAVSTLIRTACGEPEAGQRAAFENPFALDDLAAFDDEAMRAALAAQHLPLTTEELAAVLVGASADVARRVTSALSGEARAEVESAMRRPMPLKETLEARRHLLDALFWELTYWKTPDLYEALTEGERLHPTHFPSLDPLLDDKVVLDAGAGSARATVECLRQGARQIMAIEPSPGLLRLLDRKLRNLPGSDRVQPLRGRFAALPLDDESVDTAISCSAFIADPDQGGEARGFRYVALPVPERMSVRFRSVGAALRVMRRFYARNQAAMRFLRRPHSPTIPF